MVKNVYFFYKVQHPHTDCDVLQKNIVNAAKD